MIVNSLFLETSFPLVFIMIKKSDLGLRSVVEDHGLVSGCGPGLCKHTFIWERLPHVPRNHLSLRFTNQMNQSK